MRIDINLASQPYEDARRFWMRWGTALGVIGALTLVLLTMTITGWVGARHDHKVMARERAMIADCDQKRAAAEKTLSLPDNRITRDESQVLNQLIEQKAFSWTLVLENLERVMPSRIHLVAINPELGEDNQLALKMSVAGNSRDRAIELMRRMDESHRFAQTHVVSEHFLESATSGDTVQIEMASLYIPPQNTGPEAQKVEEKPAVAKAQAKANAKAATKTPMQGISRPPRTAPKGNQH
jgi:hypothetical protein